MPRITIACPDAMRGDANALGAVLGLGPHDATTYGTPIWQDAEGRLYSCASLEVSEEWLAETQQPLVRPAWDVDEQIDMDAAARAQALIVLWQAGDEGPVPLASLGALTAVAGIEGVAAVEAMGLQQVSDEEA